MQKQDSNIRQKMQTVHQKGFQENSRKYQKTYTATNRPTKIVNTGRFLFRRKERRCSEMRAVGLDTSKISWLVRDIKIASRR